MESTPGRAEPYPDENASHGSPTPRPWWRRLPPRLSRQIVVGGTKVTAAGITAAQALLPGTQFLWLGR